MSVNSTYSNDSHLHPSSISPFFILDLNCFMCESGFWVFTTITIINILLLLPLCILIIRHGFQQRWKLNFPSCPTTSTHSDTFTHHLVIMELIDIFGCVLCVCGIYTNQRLLVIIWMWFFSTTYYGESFFHVLTCLEHYLAVVHPIIYLSLRKERWLRIRNVTIPCIWLSSLGLTYLLMTGSSYLTVDFCLSSASVIVISFCSLSVLCVLTHPGPGNQGRELVRVEQSKQRAFYTITAILAVLLLKCMFLLVSTVESVMNGWNNVCMLTLTIVWINLPASLILPLLYAHKTGMLACLKRINE